jgi:hypothetical protein
MPSITAQLQLQAEKLDFLIQRVEVLDETRKGRFHQQSPAKSRNLSLPKQPLPLFQSPTSSFFCIGVLDTALEELESESHGATMRPDYHPSPTGLFFSILQGEIIHGDPSETESSESDDTGVSSSPGTLHLVDELDGGHIIRLIHLYQDMVGFMFPILDIGHILQQAENCTEWLGTRPRQPPISGNDIAILKMVIAIAMTAETEIYSDIASGLFQSIREDIETMLWNTQLDLQGLILLVLVVYTLIAL